eukprot:TRINITY_DN2348_c0_g1_i3.p1 TRINITY_DN2348_c0_g1~~TRINITY_DN2348_c0_g1_i3.p1  ORF type:complete len:389 (+),score=61.23 TRINITY_DN2348_c0_g1_i3:842-2008(+)
MHQYHLPLPKIDQRATVRNQTMTLGWEHIDVELAEMLYMIGIEKKSLACLRSLGIMHYYDQRYEECLTLVEEGSERNCGVSKFFLGRLYYMGLGVRCNAHLANELIKDAIPLLENTSDRLADFTLGFIYDEGFTVDVDFEKAIYYYEKAYSAGCIYSANCLGLCYLYETGVEKDLEKAKQYFREASDAQFVYGPVNLGITCEDEDPPQYETALEYYMSPLCSENAIALSKIGHLYYYGNGVEQNYQTAAEYLQMASDRHNLSAMLRLGYMYHVGEGVEVDLARARNLYSLCAERSETSANGVTAQFNLGYMFENGQGSEIDYVQARRLYELASAGGEERAMHNLGRMYEHGFGVEIDLDKAVEYYVMAAGYDFELSIERLRTLRPDLL